MGLETLSSNNELLNLIIYNTATPFSFHETTTFHNHHPPPMEIITYNFPSPTAAQPHSSMENDQKSAVEGVGRKKKRRKKGRVSKNKEEAETQRMTHIAVERNRRKQMNHHLSVLRSLMPESYVQRGDQASIVGGAIEFVKELEHLLQSLEAQKFRLTQQGDAIIHDQNSNFATNPTQGRDIPQLPLHFYKLFSYPQNSSQYPNKYTSKHKATIADIEVNLIHSHANLRIVLQKRLTPLSKMVVFLQKSRLSVLHLNITTLDPLVLYSISLKVEEGCWLNSADQIAGAVHQILALIEEEAILCIDTK
ncbi:transcription factor bHLH71 [Lactuca sativa]|uniref:BHLH domain-containing protein n=1 Tax=Lactuca sativa TaxID=4236 RepID=A0A9R1V959_LACSA|nr:transcription factor bHLH71 [Lactuca sativa]KAJ0201961.1 hypothetical protein LSAT_V11C600328700 [Lactuca sativa]